MEDKDYVGLGLQVVNPKVLERFLRELISEATSPNEKYFIIRECYEENGINQGLEEEASQLLELILKHLEITDPFTSDEIFEVVNPLEEEEIELYYGQPHLDELVRIRVLVYDLLKKQYSVNVIDSEIVSRIRGPVCSGD